MMNLHQSFRVGVVCLLSCFAMISAAHGQQAAAVGQQPAAPEQQAATPARQAAAPTPEAAGPAQTPAGLLAGVGVAPAYWSFAPKPPMGWNSYDAFGASVTEAEMLANAAWMRDHLLSHGYKYVVVDYRWSDPFNEKHKMDGVPGNPLAMDANGRLLPAPNRFPSAADGRGFKSMADKIHAMGLLFGIHVMRGIPRLAVQANCPIEGSGFHAADAADTKSKCPWCPDMFGVKGDSPAGQAYYDSILRLYASWGVDFVKIDDLSSNPYHLAEIAALRQAVDKCGRSIVFSTSPGETPIKHAAHIATHANMWRISGDFWDNWKSLDHAFVLAARWQGVAGPGHWPDLDMIPIGRIGIRSVGHDRATKFTKDEQRTLMSLWCLAPSPLMLGNSLTDTDADTLALIANDEAIAIDQDFPATPARRVWPPAAASPLAINSAAASLAQLSAQISTATTSPAAQMPASIPPGGIEVWIRDLHDGSKAVGFFNRGKEAATATFKFSDAGLAGPFTARDVWGHKDLGSFDSEIAEQLPSHGAVLLTLKGGGK